LNPFEIRGRDKVSFFCFHRKPKLEYCGEKISPADGFSRGDIACGARLQKKAASAFTKYSAC